MSQINQPTVTTNGVVRPTKVEVDLIRLSENYHAICQHVLPAKVMAILKANAYGHGMVAVAQMEALKADYLGGGCFGGRHLVARSWDSHANPGVGGHIGKPGAFFPAA